MSPTHSNKLGVRYRYYVSHAILQNRKAEAGIHRPEKFAEDMFARVTLGHFGALQNCRMGRRLPRKSHCSMSLSPDSPGLRHVPGIVLPRESTHRQEVRPGLGAGPLFCGERAGDGSKVEQRTLTPPTLVRIQVPQPQNLAVC
jgi:hypothetical protein